MWASKCENIYLKVLGPLTQQFDAIKDVSLIKDVSMFYAEGSSTKHQCLVSLA